MADDNGKDEQPGEVEAPPEQAPAPTDPTEPANGNTTEA